MHLIFDLVNIWFITDTKQPTKNQNLPRLLEQSTGVAPIWLNASAPVATNCISVSAPVAATIWLVLVPLSPHRSMGVQQIRSNHHDRGGRLRWAWVHWTQQPAIILERS
jgi:hypothetical protein